MTFRNAATALALSLAACTANSDGIDPAGETFTGIAPDEVIFLFGNEPNWWITVENGIADYGTPDHPEDRKFAVSRFAGNNGLGLSGDWVGIPVTITITPGRCSDGMSDRTFPYVATVDLRGETLRGCGYTDRQPYTGDPAP